MIFKAKNIIDKICQNKKQTDSIGMLVPLSNLLRHIQSGQISSHEEIEKIIDEAIVLLEDFKSAAHEDLNQLMTCQHEFNPATYTHRRMLLNWIYVFERKCKHCDFVESFTQDDFAAKEERPEWTHNAKQCYYNNDF